MGQAGTVQLLSSISTTVVATADAAGFSSLWNAPPSVGFVLLTNLITAVVVAVVVLYLTNHRHQALVSVIVEYFDEMQAGDTDPGAAFEERPEAVAERSLTRMTATAELTADRGNDPGAGPEADLSVAASPAAEFMPAASGQAEPMTDTVDPASDGAADRDALDVPQVRAAEEEVEEDSGETEQPAQSGRTKRGLIAALGLAAREARGPGVLPSLKELRGGTSSRRPRTATPIFQAPPRSGGEDSGAMPVKAPIIASREAPELDIPEPTLPEGRLTDTLRSTGPAKQAQQPELGAPGKPWSPVPDLVDADDSSAELSSLSALSEQIDRLHEGDRRGGRGRHKNQRGSVAEPETVEPDAMVATGVPHEQAPGNQEGSYHGLEVAIADPALADAMTRPLSEELDVTEPMDARRSPQMQLSAVEFAGAEPVPTPPRGAGLGRAAMWLISLGLLGVLAGFCLWVFEHHEAALADLAEGRLQAEAHQKRAQAALLGLSQASEAGANLAAVPTPKASEPVPEVTSPVVAQAPREAGLVPTAANEPEPTSVAGAQAQLGMARALSGADPAGEPTRATDEDAGEVSARVTAVPKSTEVAVVAPAASDEPAKAIAAAAPAKPDPAPEVSAAPKSGRAAQRSQAKPNRKARARTKPANAGKRRRARTRSSRSKPAKGNRAKIKLETSEDPLGSL